MATSETLRSVIEAGRTSRRLDELSAARVIGKVALQVHATQQKAGAGKSIGPVSPSAVALAASGEVGLELPATGALGYCAPEQVNGSAGDRRSDVFSLGIVMWEALTHQRLFEAMNDAAVKAAVNEREIKAPAEINANIPAELSAICMRALARNPADRYQSAKSMAVEIEEFLEEAGYPDSDDPIAAFLADLGKPREEKKVTLPPANRIKAPTAPPPAGALPSVLTAPTQPPSVLKSTQTSGAALASALANASGSPVDKSTTSPGLGPSVLVTPATGGNARTANGTAPPPLVPMPPILPSTTIAGTGAPSRAELAAEVAKIEAARLEAEQAEAARLEAEKAEAARLEAEKAEAARVEAEAARVEAEKAAAAKAEAAVAEAARAAAARAEAVKAESTRPTTQTVLGMAAVMQPPAPATGSTETASPTRTSATASTDAATPASPSATVSMGSASPASALPTSASTGSASPTTASTEAATPASASATASMGSASPASASEIAATASPAETATAAAAVSAAATGAATPGAASRASAETVQLPAATAISPDEAAPAASMTGTESRPSRPGTPHPASVVSLPQGKDKDVLAGWGWGTDSHQAISDDDDLDLPASSTNNRKLLMYLVGGGVAFTALVAIIAFGFGGSKKKPAPPPAAQTQEWNKIGSATPDSVGSAAAGSGDLGSAGTGTATGSADTGSALATAGSATTGSTDSAGSAAAAAATTTAATTTAATTAAATSPATTTAATSPATTTAATTTTATSPATTSPATSSPATTTAATTAAAKTTTKPTASTMVATTEPKPATTSTTEPKAKTPPKPPVTTEKTTPKTPKTTKAVRTTTGTPVDPYAETKPPKTTKTASKVDVEAAYRTGLQQFARGDTTGALASLRTSLAGNPNYAPTWRALGLVFEKLGEKDQARAAYKRYLQLAPSAGDAEQIRSRLERLR